MPEILSLDCPVVFSVQDPPASGCFSLLTGPLLLNNLRLFPPFMVFGGGQAAWRKRKSYRFHQLAERLAVVTRATLFFDPQALTAGQLPSYSSIQEYEKALLRSG